MVGKPVKLVLTQNEEVCQYACKVQHLQTGCHVYNYKDKSDTNMHDCEMFNSTSIQTLEPEEGLHYRATEVGID